MSGKRIFDIVASAAALILLAPVLVVVGMAVWWVLGSPVLFRQRRPGWKERPFLILKFRTMRDAKPSEGSLVTDSQRLGAFGRFLRSASLDELPQLWNVLKGDMSMVGPRPLLMEYVARYNDFERRRHEVKPGITGWAQVHGRNALSWDEKFALDVWYVDHRSCRVDAGILAATLWSVLDRTGVSQPGHATMPEFRGTPEVEGGRP